MRFLAFLALALASCKQAERSITVSGARERTLFDERFSGNLKDRPPLSWRAIPTTQFRLKNYLAGPDESVEVFLGQTQGQVLENANRWLGQFGINPAANLEFFGKIEVLGAQSYLVEAEGDFGGGMGQEPKKDQALLGVIRPQTSGVITVKMTGPKDAVTLVREEFLAYCQSLELHAPQFIPDAEEK